MVFSQLVTIWHSGGNSIPANEFLPQGLLLRVWHALPSLVFRSSPPSPREQTDRQMRTVGVLAAEGVAGSVGRRRGAWILGEHNGPAKRRLAVGTQTPRRFRAAESGGGLSGLPLRSRVQLGTRRPSSVPSCSRSRGGAGPPGPAGRVTGFAEQRLGASSIPCWRRTLASTTLPSRLARFLVKGRLRPRRVLAAVPVSRTYRERDGGPWWWASRWRGPQPTGPLRAMGGGGGWRAGQLRTTALSEEWVGGHARLHTCAAFHMPELFRVCVRSRHFMPPVVPGHTWSWKYLSLVSHSPCSHTAEEVERTEGPPSYRM